MFSKVHGSPPPSSLQHISSTSVSAGTFNEREVKEVKASLPSVKSESMPLTLPPQRTLTGLETSNGNEVGGLELSPLPAPVHPGGPNSVLGRAVVDKDWVVADTRRTEMMGVIDRLLKEGKRPGIVLIDITGWYEKPGTDADGDMRRVMGLLEYAKQKELPVFHVEIDRVNCMTPPNMRDYPHYHAANKTGSIAHFSVYPTVSEALEARKVGPLILAGSRRSQCVLNTAVGEPVRRGAQEIKEGTAANEKHDVYVAAMYAIDSLGGSRVSMKCYEQPRVTVVSTPLEEL